MASWAIHKNKYYCKIYDTICNLDPSVYGVCMYIMLYATEKKANIVNQLNKNLKIIS